MTPERFGELLRRPTLLSSQGATELEELIGRYPWSGPLRVLRYQKAIFDDDESAIQLWRTRAEPYLTTATREQREQRLRAENPTKADLHFGFGVNAAQAELPSAQELSAAKPAEPSETHEDGDSDVEEMLGIAAAVATVDWYLHRHGLIMDYGRPKPAPKEAFRSYDKWKRRRSKTAWADLLRLADEKPSRSSSRKRNKQAVPTPAVASETLADLLAAQGHHDQAISMYQQLALRYPAKKATFAARIQALQQHEV